MNRYPLWKYLLILAIIAPGFLYALPNLFGEDPAVQVSGQRTSKVNAAVESRIDSVLKKAGLTPKSEQLENNRLQFRFNDTETQLKARDLVQKELGDNYTVALNLLPATPKWLRALDAAPMFLGLDLRGGVHFLLQVDASTAIKRQVESYISDLRTSMRKEKIRYLTVNRQGDRGIEIKFRDAAEREKAKALISKEQPELQLSEMDRDGKPFLKLTLTEKTLREIRRSALEQNMTALRNRVNELGVAEPIIQQQGDDRIVIQLPGVQDTAKAKEILGRTATLEMYLVDEEHDVAGALAGRVPPGSRIYYDREKRPILLKKRLIYSGSNVVDASAGIDTRDGGPVVHITLDAQGAKKNSKVTGENIGKRMAVVYLEHRNVTKRDAEGNPILDKNGHEVRERKKIEEVITAPNILDQLGKRFQIQGLDSVEEARDLSLLLRAGALAAPVDIIEERTIGPSLGQDNINQGFEAVVIGMALVLIFMVMIYKGFGLVADVALMLNLVLLVAVLSLFQATLTLPGIAGIVLTVGMAVDANVLIFERIREELANGNTPQASIHAGYDRALTTIIDANVTTLIAAIVLFNFGTGPIKGFAITLSIGIITSMFTAIYVTRAIVNLWLGGRRLKKLPI